MAIGDKVLYKGEEFVIVENRGNGVDLWGGKSGIKSIKGVDRNKVKEIIKSTHYLDDGVFNVTKTRDYKTGVEKILNKIKRGL